MLNRDTVTKTLANRRGLRPRTVLPIALAAAVAACSWATETTCADGVGCVEASGGASAGGNTGQGGKSNQGGSPSGGTNAAGESGAGGVAPGGGGAGGEAGTGPGGGGAGGTTSECEEPEGEADLIAQPCLVNEGHAIFVAPTGSDAASGTRKAPLKTIKRALALATASPGKAVVACAAASPYDEAVAVTSGVHLYGGFGCPDSDTPWVYDERQRTRVAPKTQGPALEIRAVAEKVSVEDFEFQAADAVAAGTSSVAALVVDSPEVMLRRTRVSAGDAASGIDGVAGAKGSDGKDVGGATQKGIDAGCEAEETARGGTWPASANICGSVGGNGGPANRGALGVAGDPGSPLTHVTPASGDTLENGGARASAISNDEDASDGGPGAPGDPGSVGSPASDNGTFTDTGYVTASAATNGTDGFPGQGGGGGGASNAKDFATCIGASGGVGGLGGCGGKGGTGGGAGGASIALLSWNSGVTLDFCTLIAGNGGNGGVGGNGGLGGLGKPGAAGGAGYINENDSSLSIGKGGDGGPGGNGGNGGPGAGGNGGPSYALAFKGLEPVSTTSTLTATKGGLPGAGGKADNVEAPAGSAGTVAQKFAVTP